MPRTSGVCPRRLCPQVGAAAAWSLLLCAACAGESLLVGEERPLAGAGGDATGPDVVGSAGQDGVALFEQCPTSPGQRQELIGCWPTRHVGRWSGFFIGAPRHETRDGAGADFPPGELQLSLGDDGAGELTFGGTDAADPACDASGGHPGCPQPGRLWPGFRYRLAEVELFDPKDDDADPAIAGELPLRRAESMGFQVAVGQPWETWCAAQPAPSGGCGEGACAKESRLPSASGAPDLGEADGPPAPPGCRCDAEGCHPDAPTLAFELRMSGDGEALRGAYQPNDQSVGAATLELTRDR